MRIKLPCRFAVLSIVFVSVTDFAAAQWTQWGGPTRDFKSPETGLLDRWPAKGPKRLWLRSYDGNYATILVDDGDAYTMCLPSRKNEEMILAVNAVTSELDWYFRNPAVPDESCKRDYGLGPNATPIIHGDKIISVGFTGQAWCLRKSNGDFVWTHDLVKEYGAKVHEFGYSISPIAYGDNVIIPTGGNKQGVIAFVAETGSVAWKSELVDVSYASPILIKVDGQEQLVVMATGEIVGMLPGDGKIVWRYPNKNVFKNNCSQPVWGDGNILLVSSHGDGGGARALRLKQMDGRTKLTEIWHNEKISFFHSVPIRIDDHVYGSSGDGATTCFVAVNVKTGKIAWRERGYHNTTCLYADGKMFILDEEGKLTLAKVSPEKLTVLSSFKPLEKTAWAAPTIAGRKLYVRDQKRLFAFDLAKP